MSWNRMPHSPPDRTAGGSWRVARRDQGTRTLYRLLRRVVQGFAVFLLVIVGVVAWRKLIIEARAVTSLEYGEYVSGPRVLPYEQTKKEMKAILTDIQTGKFVRDFMQENAVGQPFFKGTRRINDEHQIEEVGKKLRGMMPWFSAGKLVDQEKN